jgi:hypothetical protein
MTGKIQEACRSLAISRLRLADLTATLPDSHPVVVKERALGVARQKALRKALAEDGWAVNRAALTKEVVALAPPKTKEEGVHALALTLLYEALVIPDDVE